MTNIVPDSQPQSSDSDSDGSDVGRPIYVKHNYELRREGWGGITFGGRPIEVRVQLTFVNGGEGGRGGGAPTNPLCLSYFFGCLSSDKYFPVRNRDLRF